jgi:hypothetical protein
MGGIMNLSRKRWFVGLVLLAIFIQPVSPSQAGTFYDKFTDNFLNPIWDCEIFGQGPMVAEVNNRLEMTIPANSSGDLGVWFVPKFFINGEFGIKGDFDEQVDFNLLNFPAGNGISFTLSGHMQFHIGRTSWQMQPGEWRHVYYVQCLGDTIAYSETTDTSGKLRLKRTGNKMEGFYWKNNAWQLLGTHTDPSFDVQDGVGMALGQNGPFSGQLVKIAFNNYQLTNQYICNTLAPLGLLLD